MWPASALASFCIANLPRTEQNFVLQNRGLGSGGENTRPPDILPFFPKQRSSDAVLPFFRMLLQDTAPHSQFLKYFHETKNKSILENPKAQLEHASISLIGIYVALFPAVSKHFSQASINPILRASLGDRRTCYPCYYYFTTDAVFNLTRCGQSHLEPLFWNCISFEILSRGYLYSIWLSSKMIPCCEDKIVLIFCSAL